MKSKKIIALSLGATLMLGTVACGGSTSNTTTAGGNTANTTSQSAGTPAINETGYPISNEKITLNFIYGKNDLTDDLATNPIFTELEEKTNIQINWEYVASEWETRKATAFASNSLPDAFFGRGNAGLSDTDIMANEAAFVDMAPLIEKYGTNIKAMFEKDPNMKAIVTTQDGKILSLPQRMPLRPNTFDVAFINQQWLDNLGLEYPETTEDFKNVLQAFKDQDANGNGDPNDEIPMSFVGTNDLAGFLSLFGSFGITDSVNANWLQVREGEVQFWPALTNYKDAMQYFHELFSNGLIDSEVFTQDFGTGTSKYRADGDPIVGVGFHWTISAGVSDKLADQYTQLLPLEGPNGDRYWRQNPDKVKGGRNFFSITTQNQYPEATLRLIDELYAEDTSIELYFGPEGKGTQFNPDGSIELLSPPDGMTEDSWQWKIGLNDSAPLYVSPEIENKIVRNEWVNTKLNYDEQYAKYVHDEWYPPVYWTKEQSSEIVMLTTDIHKYVAEMMAKWITQGGVDGDWDDYLEQLDRMKLPHLMEIYQSGYKSYKGN